MFDTLKSWDPYLESFPHQDSLMFFSQQTVHCQVPSKEGVMALRHLFSCSSSNLRYNSWLLSLRFATWHNNMSIIGPNTDSRPKLQLEQEWILARVPPLASHHQEEVEFGQISPLKHTFSCFAHPPHSQRISIPRNFIYCCSLGPIIQCYLLSSSTHISQQVKKT